MLKKKNEQPTQSRPLAQRGEITNISHVKSSGDRLRAGGREERGGKKSLCLKLLGKNMSAGKKSEGCLFHMSPKLLQQWTKLKGKGRKITQLSRETQIISLQLTRHVGFVHMEQAKKE